MSERESALQLLEQMRSRYDSGFSSADKSVLNDLYRRLYGKNIRNSGCNNCFRDAYLLIYKKLKSIKSMPTFSDYKLKAGAVIHPAGTSKFYAHRLPSNDIAEAYLSKFPDKISLFSEYPSDWRERVQRYREYAEASAASSAKSATKDEAVTTDETVTTKEPATTEEAVADEADVPAQREQETVAEVVAQNDDKGGVEEQATAEVAQEAVTEQPAATQATEQPAATATKQTTKTKRTRKKSA